MTCPHGQLARQCPICERDAARTTLAFTDIGSLPDDWSLQMVAEARIDDLIKLRDQVRDTCARAERAEAAIARLREALNWYAERCGDVNRKGDAGDTARNAIASDSGRRARAALAKEVVA